MYFGRASVPSYLSSKQANPDPLILWSAYYILSILWDMMRGNIPLVFYHTIWTNKAFPISLGILNLVWLSPAAWERRGSCSAVPQVQPIARLSLYSQWAHTHVHTHSVLCTYTHGWPHRSSQTDALSTHTNTNGTNSLILLSSLADQDEGPLVGYT